jgi:N-acyl-D-aspartate/D-glutamate deacylase
VGADPRIATLENQILQSLDKMYPLGDPPDYEPPPEASIEAVAERLGRDKFEVLYDEMLQLDGKQLVMLTMFGYADRDFEALRTMLEHPLSAFGLGDGGAHCGAICDASMTTSLISHWARDRTRGPQIPLELAVRKMTQDSAALYGLLDRGVVAPGKKADLNVIDFDRLALGLPELAHDLPGGARRLIQKARGYEATIVSGIVTLREGEHTGALPGRLIRGAQPD